MITKALSKVFGTKHERDMKLLQPLVSHIASLENQFKAMSDSQLKSMTPAFRQRLENGEPLDDLLPEAYAVCRESAKRVLGMRHYDVQMIGGITLHRGQIAEMKTGEGKTLVATLPVYLNGLTGKGVHVVTVNDYLATRDEEWMGRLYKWLGLTTGTIVHHFSDEQRQKSYAADITYGTNNEFGFDYLRDNMKFDLKDYVQRELNFTIVDECDSILIDEARTPLIISGPSEDSTDKYKEINKIIPHLQRELHFTMEEKSKTASLTEEGNSKVEELLKIDNLYDPHHISILHHIYQGLKAHHLYRKDVDYMIKDGEVMIVDEFTGRLMPGRRWSDGLHQAIEAKEGVQVKSENQTLATITFQNYFRMYNKLAGMTGTAETEAMEFKKIYNLDVSVIPTNKPIARKDEDDEVYKTERAKFKAIAEDLKNRNEKGQPSLVGTVSIEKSELLSNHLKKLGIKHNILNAKHHEREAEIVAQAGRKGAITIATNMAGRGTDIVLGGNPETMAKSINSNEDSQEYKDSLTKAIEICTKEKKDVLAAGGLYIVGTERHESRRIDNQLRGRSGRQGDPGASRFYLSLEDNLMRIFNGERIQKIMNTLKVPEDEPIISRLVTRAIEGAQRKVEGHNFDIRKHLLDYDDVMNKQRTAIYSQRRALLSHEATNKNIIERTILDYLGEITSRILDTFANENVKVKDWNFDGMNTALRQQFGLSIDFPEISEVSSDVLTDLVSKAVKEVYDRQKESLGQFFEQIAKMILLQTIDHKWKEHLQRIDHLKEGINLRSYAQKDPVIEYKKEAFRAFEEMNTIIMSETIEKLLKVHIVAPEDAAEEFQGNHRELDDSSFGYTGSDESGFFESQQPVGLPLAKTPAQSSFSPEEQETFMSRESGNAPKMNRAQRRQMEKKKKKKLKI